MFRKPVVAAAFAVAVMFVGAGCSDEEPADEPRAAGESAGPAAGKDKAPEAPDGGAEAPADSGGDVDEFCEEFSSQGGMSPDEELNEAEKAQWREDMAELVEAAPADLKPDIQVVAAGFSKVMDGEMEEDDQEVNELAVSTQRMLDWVKTNCAGYDVELEGPGAN